MHYFKETPSDSNLLLTNLRLLNYDIKDANTTFRLNIEQLSIENMKNHPKLIINIIHFIVNKLVEDEQFNNQFKQFYPPRSQLEQTLYKQEISNYLKNSNKIPRNFTITKIMMDQRIFSFLRFTSEFALRVQFFKLFPTKQLKTFYIDPQRLLMEDRPCINDLNDMFIISSYQFENLNNLNIPIQIIKLLTGLCGHQTLIQIEKLKQQLIDNCSFIDSIQNTIEIVSENLKQERDKSLKLIQQLQNFKNSIKQEYLSQERKLDRKPQLDQSYKVFNGITNIIRQYQELQLDIKMNQIQSTVRLDKFTNENNLNTLQEIHNNSVQGIINSVEKIQQQTWVQDRGQKCLNQSQNTIDFLKQLKDKIKLLNQ